MRNRPDFAVSGRRRPASALLALTAVVALPGLSFAQALPAEVKATTPYRSPSEARLRTDVHYLADDLRGGRGVGTRGIDDAADHIATVFREAGLKTAPGADGYFQPFSIRGESRVGKPTRLSFALPGDPSVPVELGTGFSPLNIGTSGKVEDAAIVFAGYGITAPAENDKDGYDDYADLNVEGKLVLILRREPRSDNARSPFSGQGNSQYATFTHKVANAAQHGARGVLLVNDSEGEDKLLDFGATPGGGAIPFVMITRALADRLLSAAGQPDLADLEKAIKADRKPQSRPLEKVTADLEVTVGREPIEARNVIGVLEGAGPLADETIVIGAHYDHLGSGGMGSLAFGSRDIHNGADDNASGTSTVLELARRLARRSELLPRRVVFMLFSGEERGLLGSAHYCEHPLFPLKNTVAMINFDMVGRLNDERDLTVFGAGTADGFDKLVESLSSSQGLHPKLIQGTRGEFNQSDHASFYRKDMPVLFFFTGTHPDYHKPSDDADKINYDGMLRITNFAELLLLDLAQRPERPKFLKLDNRAVASTPSVGAVQGGGAYFGSRPNYAFEGEGVKLDGVSEGSPAEKAGLKGGDVIVGFAGQPVKDVESYMVALGSRKPNDEVEVVILREGERKSLKVKLGARPTRSAHD